MADIRTALAGLLAFLNVNTSGDKVFEWFVNITSITGLITWDIILITYVRFYQGLKHHGIDRDTLPYKAPFQPYASYFGILFVTLVTLFNGFNVFINGQWNVDTFITAYICIVIFAVLYVGYKLIRRPKFVRVQDMDFTTGRRELNESESCSRFLVAPLLTGACLQWTRRKPRSTSRPAHGTLRSGTGSCKIFSYLPPLLRVVCYFYVLTDCILCYFL